MQKKEKANRILGYIFLFSVFFMCGWIVNSMAGYSIFSGPKTAVVEKQQPISYEQDEKPMPGDWIKNNKIAVYEDRVEFSIKNAEWSGFTDTHSMEPLLGINSNGIEIKPKSENEINIGDVIAYNSTEGIIIHRVVKKDIDEQGTYFIAKGDNNLQEDTQRIRFSQIKGVLVAVVY